MTGRSTRQNDARRLRHPSAERHIGMVIDWATFAY